MAQTKEIKPINFFNSAIKRSESFISGGLGNKGRRDADDLRAAVVFAVASIDAFFRAKTIYVLRKKRQTDMSGFILDESARKVIRKKITTKLFNKEYAQLEQSKKEAVDAVCDSKKPSLIKYLEEALNEMSFQNVNQLNEGLKMMGEKPDEIWGKINSEMVGIKRPSIMGRPKMKKRGPKVNLVVQLENLFSRRHKIVHQADLSLGRKHRGKERQIKYATVKRWIDSVKRTISKMDSVI